VGLPDFEVFVSRMMGFFFFFIYIYMCVMMGLNCGKLRFLWFFFFFGRSYDGGLTVWEAGWKEVCSDTKLMQENN
jgi:hypothetical protein